MRRITPRLMAAAAVAAIGLGALATGTASAAPADAAFAARSTQVKLHNGTGCQLNRQSYGLDHGIWSQGQEPPHTVYNTQDVSWQSESNGFMTGTEGSVTYWTSNCEEGWRDNRPVRFHWNNPYVGSNGYDIDGTDRGAFREVQQGGRGENALIVWGIYKK